MQPSPSAQKLEFGQARGAQTRSEEDVSNALRDVQLHRNLIRATLQRYPMRPLGFDADRRRLV